MNVRERVSGKWSAALIVLCLALSAVLVPVAAHLPAWIEIEFVLGIWWIVWMTLLSGMLFKGHVVEDDIDSPVTRSQQALAKIWRGIKEGSGPDPGCFAIDGCESIAIAIVAFFLFILAYILVVELVLPAIAFLLYITIRGMLQRVLTDSHDCQDNPGQALLWGMIWATAYTAPLALIVYGVHRYLIHRQ